MESAASVPLPPAGWYPDPEVSDQERYWDGVIWTEDRRLAPLGNETRTSSVGQALGQVLGHESGQTFIASSDRAVTFSTTGLARVGAFLGRVHWWGWALAIPPGLIALLSNWDTSDRWAIFTMYVVAAVALTASTRDIRWRWWGCIGWGLAILFGVEALAAILTSPPDVANSTGAHAAEALFAAGLLVGVVSELLARRRARLSREAVTMATTGLAASTLAATDAGAMLDISGEPILGLDNARRKRRRWGR